MTTRFFINIDLLKILQWRVNKDLAMIRAATAQEE